MNQTTLYILPRHWLYDLFSQFRSCGTYSVLSRSPSFVSTVVHQRITGTYDFEKPSFHKLIVIYQHRYFKFWVLSIFVISLLLLRMCMLRGVGLVLKCLFFFRLFSMRQFIIVHSLVINARTCPHVNLGLFWCL